MEKRYSSVEVQEGYLLRTGISIVDYYMEVRLDFDYRLVKIELLKGRDIIK